jgi:hypothetical protein
MDIHVESLTKVVWTPPRAALSRGNQAEKKSHLAVSLSLFLSTPARQAMSSSAVPAINMAISAPKHRVSGSPQNQNLSRWLGFVWASRSELPAGVIALDGVYANSTASIVHSACSGAALQYKDDPSSGA